MDANADADACDTGCGCGANDEGSGARRNALALEFDAPLPRIASNILLSSACGSDASIEFFGGGMGTRGVSLLPRPLPSKCDG